MHPYPHLQWPHVRAYQPHLGLMQPRPGSHCSACRMGPQPRGAQALSSPRAAPNSHERPPALPLPSPQDPRGDKEWGPWRGAGVLSQQHQSIARPPALPCACGGALSHCHIHVAPASLRVACPGVLVCASRSRSWVSPQPPPGLSRGGKGTQGAVLWHVAISCCHGWASVVAGTAGTGWRGPVWRTGPAVSAPRETSGT